MRGAARTISYFLLTACLGACSDGGAATGPAEVAPPATPSPDVTSSPEAPLMPAPEPDPGADAVEIVEAPPDEAPVVVTDEAEVAEMIDEIDEPAPEPAPSTPDPPTAPQTGSHPILNPRPPAEPEPPDAMPDEPPAFPEVQLPVDPVVELLDRLARNDEGLDGFRADITYQTLDALLGRKETRTGEIIYHLDPSDGRRRFAAMFDAVVIGARKRNQQRQYVFDGRWLAEIDYENRQFIKREVVAPGQQIDPLKLGEGPFPLPIGQPREEVERRFEVQLIARPDDGPLSRLAEDVHGLLLTPRPDTPEAEQFQSVALYFDRATLLPVGSHIIEPAVDGESDESIVLLRDLERNPVLTEMELDALHIIEPDPTDWRIDVRPWQGG